MPTIAQVCDIDNHGLRWAEQQRTEDEQCLCEHAEYAFFYSRAFGRACAGGSLPSAARGAASEPGTVGQAGAGREGASATDASGAAGSPDNGSAAHTAAASRGSPVEHSEPHEPQPGLHDGTDEARLIVRFNRYAPAAEHRASLLEALGPESPASWSWIDRHNPAARHPTDFALLSTSPDGEEGVRRRLQSAAGVRGVHADQRYTGRLAWAPEGELQGLVLDLAGAGGADGAAGAAAEDPGDAAADGPDEAVFAVTRRPGRMVTRFSSEDLEGDVTAEGAAEMEEELRQLWRVGAEGGAEQQDGLDPAGPRRRMMAAGLESGGGRHGPWSAESEEELHHGGRAGGAQQGASTGGLRGGGSRRQLHLAPHSGTVPVMLEADKLWKLGYTGKGVRVGIFDTGIRPDHPHIRNIRERTNWTHQNSLSDGLGHGSFVAGVVGGQDGQCPGFAPDVELLTFKVFTDDQVSYTSWFLDAFNYAIMVKVHVINLSIGGPDFLDQPFVDKVLEVTSNGIMLVSAIGNDGPLYGTLNNPADQNDVIGVGGIDNWDNIAGFSSRGMSTWELPRGYGRVKPDVMAYAKDVQGSKMQGGCRSLSGTSVASPVVAGAVCLLASTVPEEARAAVLNPASMKQALVEGAVRLNNLNIYEQGNGRINLPNSMAILQSYAPRASIIPATMDLTDCPYMWPFCRQHLYAGALPVVVNATLLNGQGVVGRLEGPPVFVPLDAGGRLLHVAFEWSDVLWPWSGFLALYIRVREAGAAFDGLANGAVECVVVSPPAPGEDQPRRSVVRMPFRARIGPPPPRNRRLVWDQFHSLKYPPAYLPRDNLDVKSDILDWHGDHPHTNFHGLFNSLRDAGYFLEVLGSPATCLDASQYGALLVVDAEEEWYPAEVAAVEAAVRGGMSLLVFSDWYNVASMEQMRFFDDNTRSWWTPATGGANVPALNDLLAPYGLALGDAVIHGATTIGVSGWGGVGQKTAEGCNRVVLNHGSDIAKVPAGGWLHKAQMSNAAKKGSQSAQFGFLGAVAHGSAGGHAVAFSDSNCLDRSHMTHNCYDLVSRLLARLLEGKADQGVLDDAAKLSEAYVTPNYNFTTPERRPPSEYNFTEVSYVLSHPPADGPSGLPACFPNGACVKMPASYTPCQVFLGKVAEEEPRGYSNGSTAGVKLAAAAQQSAAAGGSGASVNHAPVHAAGGKAEAGVNAGGATTLGANATGPVLVVRGGGSPRSAVVLTWGLGPGPLLVLGGLLGFALVLGLWVRRTGFGLSSSPRGPGASGASGGARRIGWGSMRQRGSEV
ncbi:hypothetical protein HYH03_002364 [Edaphochlamys debaryana]|uniref:Peptidase S8/S53 domain-containing protein n=1 Tax=Edaphochlamys debaryana TaxID=47281 RepID=A0A835YD54_9CHLO|nr:hypothetical protein HYH03_002364 [Edaphochlamys debaryana]|eukprot:KAG2499417.1 hypothetical protein HYH03_002364 [Edaphochlamys debaryana]